MDLELGLRLRLKLRAGAGPGLGLGLGPGLRLELELGLRLELTLGLEDRARPCVPRLMSALFGYSSVGRASAHRALQPRTAWVRTPRAPFVKLGRSAGSDVLLHKHPKIDDSRLRPSGKHITGDVTLNFAKWCGRP